MTILYASELAAKALNLEPAGSPHESEPCACGMCQRHIRIGDISQSMNLPKTFMDYHQTARTEFLCGYCQATTSSQSVMRHFQRSVITEHGIYDIGKDESRSWFWATPPEPPYAVVINHNTLGAFHYFWRTPVTLDNRLVQLNVDGAIFEVRRERVVRAIAYAQQIVKHFSSNPPKGSREKINSPFVILSREPSVAGQNSNGHLLPIVSGLRLTNPEFNEALNFLETLGTGELVALSSTLKKNPATPVKPEIEKFISNPSQTN